MIRTAATSLLRQPTLSGSGQLSRSTRRAISTGSASSSSSSSRTLSIQLGQSIYTLPLSFSAADASLTRAVHDLFPPSPPALALATPLHASGSLAAAEHEEGESLVGGWWNGLLRAVPKKKVSHSRKSMRSANKGLKDRVDMVHCPSCSRPKLQHHICGYCYSEINRQMKQAKSTDAASTPTAASTTTA